MNRSGVLNLISGYLKTVWPASLAPADLALDSEEDWWSNCAGFSVWVLHVFGFYCAGFFVVKVLLFELYCSCSGFLKCLLQIRFILRDSKEDIYKCPNIRINTMTCLNTHWSCFISVWGSVSDLHKFSCGSGYRIPKMSIRIQGGKH